MMAKDMPPAARMPDDLVPNDRVRTRCGGELRVYRMYGADPAAPVVLEELSGSTLLAGQFVLVSQATLGLLRDREERS